MNGVVGWGFLEWKGELSLILAWSLLSIKWNLIRLGGHAHGIVTKICTQNSGGGGGGGVRG